VRGAGRIISRRSLRNHLAMSLALAALLVGCTDEGQDAVRDRIEGALEDADLEGSELPIDGIEATEPGSESDEAPEAAETDERATEQETEAESAGGIEEVVEEADEAAAEQEPEAAETEAAETEAAETEAAETEAETEGATAAADEHPTAGWLLLLLGLVVVAGSAIAIGNHRQAQRERAALRDRAFIDVDWLLSASTDRPAAEEVVSRTLDVRARADRVHDTLGALAARSDRGDTASVLRLRGDVAMLASVTLQRYAALASGSADLDVRLGEQRERVRAARLAVGDDPR
jgi:chemotaxis protein histidine kinase CheA